MEVKANISNGFLVRLALIGLVLLGISLWFLYDGAIAYPRQREWALEYEKMVKDGRDSEWEEFAEKRGFPIDLPPDPKDRKPKNLGEIYFQLFIAIVAGLPGLLYLFFYLRDRGKWIEVNETGLRTSGGRQLEFDQIASIDKKLWKTKGIAVIHYRLKGRKRRLALDDWKYETDPTKAILCEVEAHVDVDQIVGGDPEPPPPQEEDSEPLQEEHDEADSDADQEAT